MRHRPTERVRLALGPAPRPVSQPLAERLGPRSRPVWVDPGSVLGGLWRDAPDLLRDGEVATGFVCLANRLLLTPGEHDHAALVVWSFDRSLTVDGLLRIGARAVSSYPAAAPPPRAPRERWMADRIRADGNHFRPFLLPPAVSEGFPVWISSTMMFRAHLAGGLLGERTLPLLVRRGTDSVPLVVAADLWLG